MQDQMQLLLKASESLSELYSHDFYPPPPPMNTSFPASQSPSQCQHSSHKWEQKTYQLLFSREMERSDWDQERVKLKQENDELQEKLVETRETLVRLMQDVNRVQSSFLIMNGSVKQGYDQLQLKCDNLEEKINTVRKKHDCNLPQTENHILLNKLRELKSWSDLLLKDE